MTAVDTASANIAALLLRAADRRGSAPAILADDGGVSWTFDDLVEAGSRLAGGFADIGIRRGDRVLILEPDPRRLYPIVVGVIWSGAAAMLPPLSLPLPAALRLAGHHRPRAVIATLPLWPVVISTAGLRAAPIRVTSGAWSPPGTASIGSLARHAPVGPGVVPAEAPAVVSFTTGSTGPARAVARSHGVLAAQHDALAAMRALDEETDRDFAGLPVLILHDLGSGVAGATAPRGARSGTYGRRVRGAMVRMRATTAAGFPHLFESAVRGAAAGELGGLRSIHVGGSRVRPELLTGLSAVAPAAEVTIVYGSTEVEPIAAISAVEYLARLADGDPADGICVGAVLDGLELRVDPVVRWFPRAAAGSESGRIMVRGPRAAAPPGSDGWVDTGDLGRLDVDGRLWLQGRAANAAGRASPAEVERRTEALPWVERAAFVCVEPAQGSRGRLAVQPRDWADAVLRSEWQREVESLAADRGWPLEDVVLLRRLPVVRGAAAKVDDERIRLLRTSRASPGSRR